MNIIHPIEDKRGITWALMAANNRFMVVWRKPEEDVYYTTPDQTFTDPDPAIKALEHRVELINASYLQEACAVKSLCDTCNHDKSPAGCELYCYGVLGFDEENEVVTSCDDYERRGSCDYPEVCSRADAARPV